MGRLIKADWRSRTHGPASLQSFRKGSVPKPASSPSRSAFFAAATVLALAVVGPERVDAFEFRLQGNGGYAITSLESDTLTRLQDASRPAFFTGLDEGSGFALGAALWVDGVFLPNLSVSIEYMHTEIQPDAKLRFTGPRPRAPIEVPADAVTDFLYANVAWRSSEGRIRPFVGLGGGVGYGELKIDTATFSGKLDQVIGAGHAFVGVDYELTSSLYVNATFRAVYLPSGVAGYDADALQLLATGGIGVKF